MPRKLRPTGPAGHSRSLWSRLAQAWIERIPQPVAGQIEPEHRDHDGDSRVNRNPWSELHIAAPGAEHRAPRWHRRLSAQAKEAERRLDQNRGRQGQRGLNDQWCRNVWQHVAHDYARAARADGARSDDVIEVRDSQRGATRNAREGGSVDDPNGNHRIG